MTPSKTDVSAKRAFMKIYVVIQTAVALYAGKAIVYMLERGPAQGDARKILLFQKASTDRENILKKSRRYLYQKLLESGVKTTGMSGHSLTIGKSPSYTASHNAGFVVAGLMSLCVSGSQW